MTTQVEFKSWITHVQNPKVERLLKEAAGSDIISLAGGLPSDEMFPTAEFEASFERVMSEQPSPALQYSWSEGYEPLRQQIAEYMQSRGVDARPKEILITSGAQQALNLISKLLVRPNDPIALETPTYLAAIQAFELQEPRFCAVQRSDRGLVIDSFRYLLTRQSPKFFYLIPTGHNPTGASLTEEQRLQIIDLATEYETFVIADEVYSEIQYSENARMLKSYDDVEDRILHVGSFSKVLTPGLRVGWIVATEDIIQRLTVIKQATDLQSSSMSQMVLSLYLKENSFEDHLSKCREFYRTRRDATVEALEQYFPQEANWSNPDSGFSVW